MLKRIQEPEAWEPQINQAAFEALDMAIEALDCSESPNSSDCISRQAAIAHAVPLNLFGREVMMVSVSELENLPSVQSEPAIPLSWIEGQIEWLKSLDNAFSTLTAGQILAMMNKWKDEQNERSN